ncbi:uncharacterized protein LOC6730410 [Drosophila simulans]|uniref:GD22985 n=1 Tax=Drosophila simulans TaxID=7240 RepID=B4Q5M6_DROSI|nr:uncharacterized protein LOC6730410 [Drosophila simulans]EDX03176.1 GD22985 [Drosophila simulans]KMY87244.1 uncharacterized protein Dsimw501_GD22985 [Drosophila simulans]
MGEVPKIKNLPQVIEPHLPEGCTLDSYSTSYLTKPGDNYGSIMLSVQAKIRSADGGIRDLSLIAKLPPLTNDLYWQIFQPERTCITENAVYQYLSPELDKLQLESGILPAHIFDGFPRYYGSRVSLDPRATKVDRDAVLVQENVTMQGYRPGNRHRPYNLAETVLILHYLAQYHALPIALRLKKPQVYEEFVRPYFKKFDMNCNIDQAETEIMNNEILKDIKLVTSDEREVNRVKELLDIFQAFQASNDVDDGPFTTLVHGDLWINNMMLKYGEEGTPLKVKIVDFQIAQYGSLVHDIIFVLFSSVDVNVLEDNFYNFLTIYYNAFIQTLRSVNVDTSNYTYELFLNEVQQTAHVQLPHAIFMMKVILADNSTIPKDYKDVDFSVLTKNTGAKTIVTKFEAILRLGKKFNIFY